MLCMLYNMLYLCFLLHYITCYLMLLYNMFCCVMFILRYRTSNVYVMLYNTLYLLYIMLCCVILHVILSYVI